MHTISTQYTFADGFLFFEHEGVISGICGGLLFWFFFLDKPKDRIYFSF